MEAIIVLDENERLRKIIQGSGNIDLVDVTFYIPKASYNTYSFSCILKQGEKVTIIPLTKTNTDHSTYSIYKCDLLPIRISGTHEIYISGVEIEQHSSFISKGEEEIYLVDNMYKTSFQVYQNAMLKSELATMFVQIQEMTKLNIQIYEENKKLGGEVNG